ncbi:unnamed protein product [Meloidogyne enterolobii]|uniref:Uncharacterized protein n=1 Tax=Meloidogyne enterolobii TaxID=390850 RepID=A0ACB0ZEM4_MELEN
MVSFRYGLLVNIQTIELNTGVKWNQRKIINRIMFAASLLVYVEENTRSINIVACLTNGTTA